MNHRIRFSIKQNKSDEFPILRKTVGRIVEKKP